MEAVVDCVGLESVCFPLKVNTAMFFSKYAALNMESRKNFKVPISGYILNREGGRSAKSKNFDFQIIEKLQNPEVEPSSQIFARAWERKAIYCHM